MFEFLFIIGLFLAYYGYSVMKNPKVWGDQGRDNIKPENWNGYVVRNGQFLMYAGFFLAALAALDVIFTFNSLVFVLVLLGGLALLLYPLSSWMKEKEGTRNPWPHRETEKQKRKRIAKEQARAEKKK